MTRDIFPKPKSRASRAMPRLQKLVEEYMAKGMKKAAAEAKAHETLRSGNSKGDWRRRAKKKAKKTKR